ncbi:YhgE/Pip domain-containing protein [Halobacillus litoralis]|uniref:YhgE/Pip domain-containing protein n=1 Tax=Halobacillus litoralis TaxID=45668 RepID=UPI001CD32F2F|nr:YhgE/Pip domain-containing protein [Halobacillus litoralis]MCA0970528.1 YhgE/Pip domain-containing protein [Halobacillus litoralis]
MIKRITAALMVFLLVLPSLPVSAATYSEKHEVIYATLDANGGQEDMYVVNNFTVNEPGNIVDYGSYTSVHNLTNLEEITQNGEKVEVPVEGDEFYYQGNLKEKALPWDVNVSYKLDGEAISPDELAGKDGALEVQIDTARNEQANDVFFNHYLMQITLQLDSSIFDKIEAEGGTIANAGKDRRVTFTVMPENEGSFVMTADVTDLEMEPIEFAAVPSSMSINAPDTGSFKSDMTSLSDATAAVNRGVVELKDGIAQTNNGAASLYDGSAEYKNGIQGVSNGSAELVQGSADIQAALNQMSQSVSGSNGGGGLGDLTKMEDGLRQAASGLKEAENGLLQLKKQYGQANNALSQSVAAIPSTQISEADIQKLYESGADANVVDQLVQTHKAAQAVKGTHAQVKEAFNAVGPSLDQSAASLNQMSASLTSMADQLSTSLNSSGMDESMKQLQQGLQQLSSNYKSFHSGLKEYTGGVDQLAGSYSDLHNGIAGLTNGTSELEQGAAQLQDGTSQLASETSNLPMQLDEEINSMVEEYDKSDFEPVSFVSEKNENIGTVQFVIKTESIKQAEETEEEPEEEPEKSFWDRLMDLFR